MIEYKNLENEIICLTSLLPNREYFLIPSIILEDGSRIILDAFFGNPMEHALN